MSNDHRRLLWSISIVTASLGFSLAFACATPFAALGAAGALQLRLRDASAAVLLAWLGNQAIGFTVLHYPLTSNAFAWGAAIGIAALAGLVVARGVASLVAARGLRLGGAILGAFAAYENVLYAADLALTSGGNAFSAPIVMRIFAINAVAFLALVAIHSLVVGIGLLRMQDAPRAAIA